MRVAIRAKVLIDGTGGGPLLDPLIIVENGGIQAVGAAHEVEVPKGEGVEIIDLMGETILPGLIDAHAHVASLVTGQTPEHQISREYHDMLLLRSIANAQRSLIAGVTTIRDCGGHDYITLSLKRGIETGVIVGPRVLVSGMPITTRGGHLWFLGLEADTVDEVRNGVRELVKNGVDFIKVCATGGAQTSGTNKRAAQYGVAELKAIVEEAHGSARKVAAHVHGTEGIRSAVEAGIDTLEHCSWLGKKEGTDYDEETVREIEQKRLYVCITVAEGRRVLLGEEEPREEERELIEWLNARYELYRRMREAGVKMILGSDAGAEPAVTFRDFALSVEVMQSKLQMSTMEAIIAATRDSAEALGLQQEIGTIEVGKRADLIAVEGDPLKNIRALRRVDKVMKDGQIVVSEGMIIV